MTSNRQSEQILVNAKAAATMLAISERTLWGLDIPRVRIGRAVRYDIEDIREWIAKRKS